MKHNPALVLGIALIVLLVFVLYLDLIIAG
jgi:hypothetical protein